MTSVAGTCTPHGCASGQSNTLGFRVLRCSECPKHDPCRDAEWRLSLCVSRSDDVAVVVTSSDGLYEILDNDFGSPCFINKQWTVSAGTSIQVAWVPRPGVAVTPDRCDQFNELRNLSAAVIGDKTTLNLLPYVQFSTIPGTEKVYGPPTEVRGNIIVTPGTVATVQNIGRL